MPVSALGHVAALTSGMESFPAAPGSAARSPGCRAVLFPELEHAANSAAITNTVTGAICNFSPLPLRIAALLSCRRAPPAPSTTGLPMRLRIRRGGSATLALSRESRLRHHNVTRGTIPSKDRALRTVLWARFYRKVAMPRKTQQHGRIFFIAALGRPPLARVKCRGTYQRIGPGGLRHRS